MNIIEVFNEFRTQEQAVEYLEEIRWRGRPVCPYCGGEKVCRHVSCDRKTPRWQCQSCRRAFSVTVGTIFHRTHIPLRSWFLVIALMLNAKKSASACQIARDVGIRRPTVWSMMHRIRSAMAQDKSQGTLLHGIVEVDETYVGGKPRKKNKRYRTPFSGPSGDKSKCGAGTDKTPVIGGVERNGNVVAEPLLAGKVNASKLLGFIRERIDRCATLLITDQFSGYRQAGKDGPHASIDHVHQYVDGQVHTNTIESFWALVKRAFHGQHHHYSKKYMSLYISEACYKFNIRHQAESFEDAIALMVSA